MDYNLGLGIDISDLDSGLSRASNSVNDFANDVDRAGKEVKETFDKQAKATDEAVKGQKKLNKETEKEIKTISSLNKKISQLKIARDKANKLSEVKAYNKEIEKTEKIVKDLKNETDNAGKGIGRLFSGFKKNAKEAGSEIDNGLGLGLKGLINPVTVLTGAVIGLGAGYLKAKKDAEILDKVTKNLFGDSANIDSITRKTKEIANVYDQEVNEVLKTANVLSKEFGVSGEQSLNLIEQGIRRGADLNGDFLDQIKEYSTQFEAVGVNAEGAIAIITQTVNRGVFSDKGVDLIKEAGIRLRELTPATRSALKAVGFTSKEIETAIRSGTINTFEFIQEVSKKLKSVEGDSKVTGQVLADVFGGAGEDAGKFVTELGDISTNIEDVADNTGDLENAQQGVSRAWSNFIDSVTDGDSILTTVFTGFLNLIESAIEGLDLLFSSTESNLKEQINLIKQLDAESSNKVIGDNITRRNSLLKKGNEELQRLVDEGKIRDIAFAQRIITQRNQGLTDQEILITKLEEGINRESKGLDDYKNNLESARKEQDRLSKEVGKFDELFGGETLDAFNKAKDEFSALSSEVELRSATINLSNKQIIQTIKSSSDSQLKDIKKGASERVQVYISEELERRKIAKRSEDDAKKEKSNSRDINKLKQERLALEKELARLLIDLDNKVNKARLDQLEGEEKILAVRDNQKSQILTQQAILLELNEKVGKDVAVNKAKIIEDTASLIFEAEENAKKALERLREGEDVDNVNNTLGAIDEGTNINSELLKLNLKKEVGESDIDFERRKEKTLIDIQKKASEEKLKFLRESGAEENDLRVLGLRNQIKGFNEELNKSFDEDVNLSIEGKFDNFLKEAFGLDDNGVAELKNTVSDLANTLIENYSATINNQIEERERLIDSYDQNISDLESQIEREISKNLEGNASNIAGLEERLEKEKQAREKANQEKEALLEKERKFRKTIAIAELAQNTALQISNLALAVSRAAGESGVGAFVVVPALIGLLATLIGGISSLATQPDTSGFFDGGFTGGNSIHEERGVVHGKEFVHTADKTARHRNLFEGIHTDNDNMIALGIRDLLSGTGITIDQDLPKRVSTNDNRISKEVMFINNRGNEEGLLRDINNSLNKKEEKVERYFDNSGNEIIIRGNTKTIIRK